MDSAGNIVNPPPRRNDPVDGRQRSAVVTTQPDIVKEPAMADGTKETEDVMVM